MTKLAPVPIRAALAALTLMVITSLPVPAAELAPRGCRSPQPTVASRPLHRAVAPPGVAAPSRADTKSPEAKGASAPVSSAPTEPRRENDNGSTIPGKQETAPALDLKSLEKRLRETKAIGVFTKLSLKNQVDDLLSQFRILHQGKGGATLAELRQSYELLLLKVLSLLQDSDKALAREIVASREAIWSLLADPAKFAAL